MLVYSQKGPNMGGDSCTVLRLRLMHTLAMSRMGITMQKCILELNQVVYKVYTFKFYKSSFKKI